MRWEQEIEFGSYLEHLAQGLGHADRHGGLKGYCTGLMLPLARKSIEPLAAGVDPLRVSARHQSLYHFVAKADWSDEDATASDTASLPVSWQLHRNRPVCPPWRGVLSW